MSTTTVIYKSITLTPGEQFTLPPNAELVGASSPADLESSCDLPSLATLECFELVVFGADEAGSQGRPYEKDDSSDLVIRKLVVSGVEYDIPDMSVSGWGQFDFQVLINYLSATPALQGVIIDPSWATANSDDRGGVTSLCFKSFSDVALTIHFIIETYFLTGGTSELKVFAKPYGTHTGIGQCNCSI